MAINLRVNPRNRHIAIYYHFTCKKIGSGNIELEYIPFLVQLADIFVKPIGKKVQE